MGQVRQTRVKDAEGVSNKLKILQVVEACGAGVGRHVRCLCGDLAAQGHHVTVAYAPHRVDVAFRRFMIDRQNEIDFMPLKLLGREISPKADLISLFQLLRLIRLKGPFDIVHGHSSKGGAIARLAGRLAGFPTVYTPHGLAMSSEVSGAKSAAYALIERTLGYGATSKIIAVSEGEREFILALKLIPGKRVALVNNGVDPWNLEYFSGHKVVRGTIDEKPLTFGSIMRFSPPKTPGHLVEAFGRLCAAMPRVPMRLAIAGDGELLPRIRRQVEESGLDEKVSLLGWRTDTKDVMLGFDVFVLSSLSEGGSYTILDAMAAGLPVISTDVFGTEETIAQVPGNVLVPAGDPDALACGMQRIVNLVLRSSSHRALEGIGQANHDYVCSHFEQSKTTRRTLEIYRELTSGERKNHAI